MESMPREMVAGDVARVVATMRGMGEHRRTAIRSPGRALACSAHSSRCVGRATRGKAAMAITVDVAKNERR